MAQKKSGNGRPLRSTRDRMSKCRRREYVTWTSGKFVADIQRSGTVEDAQAATMDISVAQDGPCASIVRYNRFRTLARSLGWNERAIYSVFPDFEALAQRSAPSLRLGSAYLQS